MKRNTLIVLGILGALFAGFILTPASYVDRHYGDPVLTADQARFSVVFNDGRPQKSGLRVAVEGRLKWLGIEP